MIRPDDKRLTQYSPSGGCGCKLPQSLLGPLLSSIRATGLSGCDARLLVGLDKPDDAAVYAVDEKRAWVVTCDFLTPIVDDPYVWGRIAATNALSDVYAMGGVPLFVLNLLCWPQELPEAMMLDVLRGGGKAITDAGALVAGGHSIIDPVPKFGLVAIGEVDPRKILTKGGGRPGDLIVLTKPLGVGAISTAIKQGKAPPNLIKLAEESMTRLKASAARIASAATLQGGTDVTGYGLIGHLHEMAAASGFGARIWSDDVPMLPGVIELIASGCSPNGAQRTLENALTKGWFVPSQLQMTQQLLLADPQTSGGMLLAVSRANANELVAALRAAGDAFAAVIGEFLGDEQSGVISVQHRIR
jgi:selenide,water dikinase